MALGRTLQGLGILVFDTERRHSGNQRARGLPPAKQQLSLRHSSSPTLHRSTALCYAGIFIPEALEESSFTSANANTLPVLYNLFLQYTEIKGNMNFCVLRHEFQEILHKFMSRKILSFAFLDKRSINI